MPPGSEDGPLLQIGDVAERVGLSLRTVRYYEEMGLISPSSRSEGGFRLYSEDDVRRLTLVKRMKALGLSLGEMGELVKLTEDAVHPDDLPHATLRATVDGLRQYVERSDKAIERSERDLVEARQLRLRIGEQLARCESLLDHRSSS